MRLTYHPQAEAELIEATLGIHFLAHFSFLLSNFTIYPQSRLAMTAKTVHSPPPFARRLTFIPLSCLI